MKKKAFWKRTNRGFWVTLALLACVLVYVLVTQLMLLSVKSDLRGLADAVRDLNQSVHILSDERLQALQDETAMKAETERVKKELEPLFDPDSDYLDAAVETLLANMPLPDGMSERTRTAEEAKRPHIEQCTVDGDVAAIRVLYNFRVTGDYYNYDNYGNYYGEDNDVYAPQPVESAEEDLVVSLTCKKVNGGWKIFRVGAAQSYSYNQVFKEAES